VGIDTARRDHTKLGNLEKIKSEGGPDFELANTPNPPQKDSRSLRPRKYIPSRMPRQRGFTPLCSITWSWPGHQPDGRAANSKGNVFNKITARYGGITNFSASSAMLTQTAN